MINIKIEAEVAIISHIWPWAVISSRIKAVTSNPIRKLMLVWAWWRNAEITIAVNSKNRKKTIISSIIAALLSLIEGEINAWKSGIKLRKSKMINKIPNRPIAITSKDCKKRTNLITNLLKSFNYFSHFLILSYCLWLL